MPAEQWIKRAIAAKKELSEELLTKVGKALDESTTDEGELRKLKGDLELTLEGLKKSFQDLSDHYLETDDIPQDTWSNHLREEKDCILPLKEQLSLVSAKLKPKESSSRSWCPQMRLETFTGELGRFQSFMDSFEASVDRRSDLHEVDKLQILKDHLKGDPKTLVNTFQATAKNYHSVKEILKSRYGNQCRYELNLAKEFADLKPPSHSLKELNRFHSVYEATIRSMENVGCNLEACEWLMLRMLKSKLKEDTWNALSTLCNVEKCGLEEFRKCFSQLLSMIEAMPKGEETQPKVTQAREGKDMSNSSSGNQKAVSQKNGYWRKGDVGSYHISSEGDSSQRPASKKKPNGVSVNQNSSWERLCLFCDGTHRFPLCSNYATVEERQRRIAQLKRCLICIRRHDTSACNTRLDVCWKCKQGEHHAALCQGPSATPKEEDAQVAPVVLSVHAGTKIANGAVPTAQAVVNGANGPVNTRAFLDFGAQKTFVSADLIKELKITPTGSVPMTIDGFTGPWPRRDYPIATLEVSIGDKSQKITAIVVDKLPGGICVEGLKESLDHLQRKGIKMADPSLDGDVVTGIGILLGTDQAFTYFKGATTIDNINLFETTGGYTLAGPMPNGAQSGTSVTSVTVANVSVPMNPILNNHRSSDLERFIPPLWELESIGVQPESYTPEEATAYGSYTESVIYQDYNYWVKIPWKMNKGYLPTNFPPAKQRLQSIIKEEERGFIERVQDAQVNQSTHYLPHLAVIKDSKTTPIRIVLNSSAKQDTRSNSLNYCLYSGPSLTENQGKVLVEFRTNPFAFAADVSKAFLRVGLQAEERDFTRFLWPENPSDSQGRLVDYRFRSVLFGATSSSFLLQVTWTHHLNKSERLYAEKIKESLYVDNLQGTDAWADEKELLDFHSSANQTMTEANMHLQSWCTNSAGLQEVASLDQDEDQKFLGINWNIAGDALSILEVEFECGSLTKRKLLSSLSRVFDPLGLLSPLTIQARVLMQETRKLQLDWDSILPETILEQWKIITPKLKGLSQISFPRETCREGKVYDLHVFRDASPKAYGVVAYVTDGVQTPQLVMAKAKVAPDKTKTLPQLEHTASYVGVKLQQSLRKTLINIQFKEVFIWGDSEVALCQVKINGSRKVLTSKGRLKANLKEERPSRDYPSPAPSLYFRVDPGTPFLTTGVEYSGALHITDVVTGDTRKVYVVLFTCATTRAVHLELAVDLTDNTFLNVFRRFAVRRSCPQFMISDNSKYFQQSASLLRQIMEDAKVKPELSERGCTWKFIPHRSLWPGGFYDQLWGQINSGDLT